jgi:hypothetical protein
MFPHVFYHGKRFDSTAAGARLVPVKCDQCGCEYFYELARIGDGAVSAYLMAHAAAAELAEEKSQRDLQDRLSHEAELVPCPRCNWINEALIDGYRRGRFRNMGKWALGVAGAGTAGSFMMAWFVWIGPPIDRALAVYPLLLGPALFCSISAVMLLLRKWM